MKLLMAATLISASLAASAYYSKNDYDFSPVGRVHIETEAEEQARLNPTKEENTLVAGNELGKDKFGVCAGCHGATAQGGIGPKLAGNDEEYIKEKLSKYKAGETVGAQSSMMWGVASSLSDDDIQALAGYISKTFK